MSSRDLLRRLLLGIAELRVELFDQIGGGLENVCAGSEYGLRAGLVETVVIRGRDNAADDNDDDSTIQKSAKTRHSAQNTRRHVYFD